MLEIATRSSQRTEEHCRIPNRRYLTIQAEGKVKVASAPAPAASSLGKNPAASTWLGGLRVLLEVRERKKKRKEKRFCRWKLCSKGVFRERENWDIFSGHFSLLKSSKKLLTKKSDLKKVFPLFSMQLPSIDCRWRIHAPCLLLLISVLFSGMRTDLRCRAPTLRRRGLGW
ncbi:alpha/beta-Hydrolases superfamily protein [Striga asiatica]|uniref:Alpha/beta-Hydrolases superfamily protein n=1 Tax=Striga asiatica TaxID=4170 RepID=A0A5A7R1Q7_STRAF|nr:alpha/beta-Hydrolases superfamily protein [Striga asiatica]